MHHAYEYKLYFLWVKDAYVCKDNGSVCSVRGSINVNSGFRCVGQTSAEAVVQTTESDVSPEMYERVYIVCGEVEGVNRMWIGREVKECKFLRHAWCMGMTAYRDRFLKSVRFSCPIHIGKTN